MMHYLNQDKKSLHQHYSHLSKQFAITSKHSQRKNILYQYIWSTISSEGIWRLPIAKQYNGTGLHWQDCIEAVDGLFSYYSNPDFLSLVISQVKALYITSQYATKKIKKIYLPRLTQGERGSFYIAPDVLPPHSCFHKIQGTEPCLNSHIIFSLKKGQAGFAFRLIEKNNQIISIQQNHPLLHSKAETGTFIVPDINPSALCDLINFEKLIYSVLSASFTKKFDAKIGWQVNE